MSKSNYHLQFNTSVVKQNEIQKIASLVDSAVAIKFPKQKNSFHSEDGFYVMDSPSGDAIIFALKTLKTYLPLVSITKLVQECVTKDGSSENVPAWMTGVVAPKSLAQRIEEEVVVAVNSSPDTIDLHIKGLDLNQVENDVAENVKAIVETDKGGKFSLREVGYGLPSNDLI